MLPYDIAVIKSGDKYHEKLSKHVPFIQHDAALSILRVAEMIGQQTAAVMKPFDLTGPQFNVLRILRGAPDGLACGAIGGRMIQRDPDVTRLLVRLECRGLIVRQRCKEDRRVVTAKISRKGLDLLAQIDPLVNEVHLRQFAGFSELELREVIEVLERVLGSESERLPVGPERATRLA